MLKLFEVENFKGFHDKLVFDLTARDYSFNPGIVKDGIVNKGIVYGKNGSGKSNLGFALFDIVSHLTDKEKMNSVYVLNYRNLNEPEKPVSFRYVFQFDYALIEYKYVKYDPANLIEEQLFFDDEMVLKYNYFSKEDNYISPTLKGDLNIELIDNKLSVLKYIYRNTPTDSCPMLDKLIRFCENMLWYRSLSEGNVYAGFSNGSSQLTERLYESGKLHEFEEFLRENGLAYKLGFEMMNGERELYAYFGPKNNKAPFMSIASTGTRALFLYYIWSIYAFKGVSFLFIDEFDAFFHYESAEMIVKSLNYSRNFQSVLTSHNTYLMRNNLTRPDCCYIITENKIKSLFNSTDREIREAHNLEKMYINGAFTE